MKHYLALILSLSATCLALTCHADSFAYITNQAADTVSVIDVHTRQVVSTIAVGKAPVGVAVSASLQRVYVSNVEGQSISVIDASSNQRIQDFPIAGSPVGLALSPDSTTLYVADWYDDRILALDTQDLTRQRTLAVGKAPAGMVISPDGKQLYIANRDSDDVAVVDTASFSLQRRISVGKHPFGLTLTPDGGLLLVVNVMSDSLSIINTASGDQRLVKVGQHPYCVATDGRYAYVTNTQDDSVTKVDLQTAKALARIKVGEVPEGISMDSKAQRLLVASWGADAVSVIDTGSDQVIDTIATGKQSRAFGDFILHGDAP